MVPQSLSPHAEGKGTRKPGENTLFRGESAAPCVFWDKRCLVFLVDQKGCLKRGRWCEVVPKPNRLGCLEQQKSCADKSEGFPWAPGAAEGSRDKLVGKAALASRLSASEHPQPSMGVGGRL